MWLCPDAAFGRRSGNIGAARRLRRGRHAFMRTIHSGRRPAAGVMEATKAREFSAKVAKLRKSDPVVDWSSVTEMENGRRRVAQRLSEVVAAK